MSNLCFTDCTLLKNQIDSSFPLEEPNMEGLVAGNYELGYRPDQEGTGE